jgi:hypothetical protein
MGKMKQSLIVLVALGVLIAGGMVTLILNAGYSIDEMDWDSDGRTTLTEMFRSIDVRRREVKRDGVECQEFYNLKDGLPVRVDCPKP